MVCLSLLYSLSSVRQWNCLTDYTFHCGVSTLGKTIYIVLPRLFSLSRQFKLSYYLLLCIISARQFQIILPRHTFSLSYCDLYKSPLDIPARQLYCLARLSSSSSSSAYTNHFHKLELELSFFKF